MPDRIVICTGSGCIMFLELKQLGKKPTPLQMHEIERLRAAGCNAQWADRYEDCQRLINEFCP